jgi:hypothetical protein
VSMTIDEFIALVSKITYKPGCKIFAQREGDAVRLRIEATLPDSSLGTPRCFEFSQWLWPDWIGSEKEALHVVAGHVREFEMHEMDEWLKLDGARVKEPHPRRI